MWSRKALRAGLIALGLALPLALAGCSGVRPLYGEGGITRAEVEFYYAKPTSRLEQIIIQDLSLRLGRTENPGAPTIRISASAASRALTRTNVVKPATQHEVTVTATYTIEAGGEVMASGTRRASASYSVNTQVLADTEAYDDAVARAGHAVADTIRLAILGQLSAPARGTAAGQ